MPLPSLYVMKFIQIIVNETMTNTLENDTKRKKKS